MDKPASREGKRRWALVTDGFIRDSVYSSVAWGGDTAALCFLLLLSLIHSNIYPVRAHCLVSSSGWEHRGK